MAVVFAGCGYRTFAKDDTGVLLLVAIGCRVSRMLLVVCLSIVVEYGGRVRGWSGGGQNQMSQAWMHEGYERAPAQPIQISRTGVLRCGMEVWYA